MRTLGPPETGTKHSCVHIGGGTIFVWLINSKLSATRGISYYLTHLHEVVEARVTATTSTMPPSKPLPDQLSCRHRNLSPDELYFEEHFGKSSLYTRLRQKLFNIGIPPGHRHLTFTSSCNEFHPTFDTVGFETCEHYIHRLRTRKLLQRRESHELSGRDLDFEDAETSRKGLRIFQGQDPTIDHGWDLCAGCSHSDCPDMMISHGRDRSIMTSLYSKQCDGTYVSGLGELKRMRYGDRRVIGVDLLMRGELYDFFDRLSWTDNLEEDELVLLFGDPLGYKCEQSSTGPHRAIGVDLLMKDELHDFFDRSSWTDDL